MFRRVKKCESITTNEIPAPTAVARPGAEHTHVQREYTEVIAEHDENSAGQHAGRHQRRRAVRPLILADHRHVHNAVNARDERAAERRQKVFAVNCAHIALEQIHRHPP